MGNIVESLGQWCPVSDDPIVHLVRAGVDRGASRRAGRGLGVVATEANPFARDAVQRWCLYQRMTGRRVGVPAELIQRDEQDVHFAAST